MRILFALVLATACGGPTVTIAMIQQNNSGQDGTATLSESGGGTEIIVRIHRSNIGGAQSSHVHLGRCDNVGLITSGLSNVTDQPTFEDEDLVFKTKLQQPMSELRDGNHVINVHDARDNSLYVSCGEIN